MDVHIELSYCRKDAFRILAKNYLRVESHPMFESIERMLEDVNVTPAHVAENLMPRSVKSTNAEDCLKNLVMFLEKMKVKSQQEIILKNEEEETDQNK